LPQRLLFFTHTQDVHAVQSDATINTREPARVVAIVLNRNRGDLLAACLQKLRCQTIPLSAVILVDDASTDDSVEGARSFWPGIHVVALEEPSGVIAARNAGLEFAQSELNFDYVCYLDNDAFLEPSALEEMVAAARADAEVGMVTPKAYQSIHERRLACAGGMTANFGMGLFRDTGSGELDRGQFDEPRDVVACPGFTFLVRKEVVLRVGPFDNGLRHYGWEDVDYSLRVRKAGFRLRYAPQAVVEHKGGHAGRGIVAAYERAKLRNLFVLMHRHASAFQWLCFLGVLPLRCAYVAARLAGHAMARRLVMPQRRRSGVRADSM
jgi:GT2 family glycosyltransferase